MYASSVEPRRWWRRPGGLLALALALLLAAAVTGVVIGRATTTSSTAEGGGKLPPVSNASLDTPHGPTRMQDELPVGFTDDKGGAMSFVATAGQVLLDFVQARRTTSVAKWMASYTTGRLSNLSLQKIYDWNPLTTNVTSSDRPTDFGRPPQQAVVESTPVGYKLLPSFTSSAAHLIVWFHGFGWKEGAGQPELVVNNAMDVQLAWANDDWKITSITNPPHTHWDGPTPGAPEADGYAPWPGGQFTFVTG
jgi:hypothetical protein